MPNPKLTSTARDLRERADASLAETYAQLRVSRCQIERARALLERLDEINSATRRPSRPASDSSPESERDRTRLEQSEA